MSSKARKLVKGSILGTVNFFANALAGLVLMPFIVHALGDRMYGLWMIVGSMLGFYGLFDFGLVFAVQRYMSRAIGKEDYDETNKFVNTSFFLYAIIGFVILFLLVIVSVFAPLLVKNFAEINLFRSILIVLGLSVAIGFPMRVFSGVLISHIRYDLYNSIELFMILSRVILVIVFLSMGYGILALALINFSIEIIGYVLKFIVVKILYKYIVFSRKAIDIKILKPLLNYSFFSFIIQVVDRFRLDISSFVIAAFMGLEFVTIYSIASNLMRYFCQFISSFIGLLMPVFSQYEGRGDYASIREKYILSVKISGYMSTLVGGTLILFGRVFIERWMGSKYLETYPILVILTVSTMLTLIQSPAWGLLYGTSKHKFLAVANTVESVSVLILSLILVKRFGLLGVAFGSAIPMMIVKVFIQPIYICRVIGFGIRRFYINIMGSIIVNSMLVFVILWQIFKSLMMPNYLNMVILMSSEWLILSIFIFFVGFSNDERNYFKKAIFESNN